MGGRDEEGARSGTSAERIAGAAVLLALAGVAFGVYASQSRYDPALFRAPAPLPGAAAAGEPAEVDLFGLALPPGIAARGRVERFDTETLHHKIDGKADLYLSAGFVELRCLRLAAGDGDAGVGGAAFEACVYDMGGDRGAFAVHSSQRREDGLEIALAGAASYTTSNALFAAAGRYYLELVSPGAGSEAAAGREALARAFVALHRPAQERPPETALFPAEDLGAEGPRLIPDSAFGFARLDQVFVAPYALDGSEALAFLSTRADAAEATALAEAYAAFLVRNGATEVADGDGAAVLPGARILEVYGSWELVFARGRLLAGVHEASTRAAAVLLAGRLAARLGDVGP